MKELHEAARQGTSSGLESVIGALMSSPSVDDGLSPSARLATFINSKDDSGVTALMKASHAAGGGAAVALLLSHHADATCLDDQGFTALHWAAMALDAADVILLLLKHGLAVDARSDLGETPSHRFVSKHDF